jgi:hypothetical protein
MSLKDQLQAAGGSTAQVEAADEGIRVLRLEAEIKAMRRELQMTRTIAIAALAGVVGLVVRGLISPMG